MLRIFWALIAFFMAFASQANEFSVDPFDIVITHPQRPDENGRLTWKNHVLLTFPYRDDIVITNNVNEARKNNRLLKFTDYFDSYGQEATRFMQLHDHFPYDESIEFAPENVSFHGAKRSEFFDVTFSYAYIQYKSGSRKNAIYIYFRNVEDYLASLIATAKEEKKKIIINTESLRHRKKQQYVPLRILANIPL